MLIEERQNPWSSNACILEESVSQEPQYAEPGEHRRGFVMSQFLIIYQYYLKITVFQHTYNLFALTMKQM